MDIYKSYEGESLLKGITFKVSAGETVCLLGPSGSGKSTLLRLIAGLELPDRGTISWDGEDLLEVPAHRRGFGMVFQDYALFPHLDVAGNVAFGLKMQGIPKEARALRVAEMLELVNLDTFQQRTIDSLSGGEQQRVALARALASSPRLLLFDEPLGALDPTLKGRLLDELRLILRKSRVGSIYVTHDQEEALSLADRVLLLHNGQILRAGTPYEVWSDPGSSWAAKFLEAGNVIRGTCHLGTQPMQVDTTVGRIPVFCNHAHQEGEDVEILLPMRESRDTDDPIIKSKVKDVFFKQDEYKVVLDNGLFFYLFKSPPAGETVGIRVAFSGIKCLGRTTENPSGEALRE
jgi:ABC-type Fe3+/spermidine/putrescine transport system ATPase subunit